MVKIENLDKFRGKMKWTTVTKDGKVTISRGPEKYVGQIAYSAGAGYCIDFGRYSNCKPFDLAGVEKLSFMESVLGYIDRKGSWPWMKSTDDILKVLVELDKLYMFKGPGTELPKSMETEHPSIADIDFAPKKKHYSLNFRI